MRFLTATWIVTGVAFAMAAAAVRADPLYRFVSAEGHLVFTDRLPNGTGLTRLTGRPRAASGSAVRLLQATQEDGTPVLLAVNEIPAWAQVAFRIESSRNLDPDSRRAGNFLLPPLSQTVLTSLATIDDDAGPELDISYQYLLGHPGARHQPNSAYRLPYLGNESYRVSQAYPDARTHASAANRYAIDFEMPVGTQVLAARDGLVVEIEAGFRSSTPGTGANQDYANFVRILHDDGSFALYGHLDWQSVYVVPGERVVGGQHIADSGNTGFSGGPHLHFVVQLNHAGAIESVPVTFVGAAGAAVTLKSGDRPVAY